MSNNKHFADLLKVCSILPALAIMPAMAGENIVTGDASLSYQDVKISHTTAGTDDALGVNAQGKATIDFTGDITNIAVNAEGNPKYSAAVFNYNGKGTVLNFNTDKIILSATGSSNSVLGVRVNGDGDVVNLNGETEINVSSDSTAMLRAIDVTDGGYVSLNDDTVLNLTGGKDAAETIGILSSGSKSVDLAQGKDLAINASGVREVYGLYAQYGGTINMAQDTEVDIHSTATGGDAYGVVSGFYAGAAGTIDSKGEIDIDVSGDNAYGLWNFGGSSTHIADLDIVATAQQIARGIWVTDDKVVDESKAETTDVVIGSEGSKTKIIAKGADTTNTAGVLAEKLEKDVGLTILGDVDIESDGYGVLAKGGAVANIGTEYAKEIKILSESGRALRAEYGAVLNVGNVDTESVDISTKDNYAIMAVYADTVVDIKGKNIDVSTSGDKYMAAYAGLAGTLNIGTEDTENINLSATDYSAVQVLEDESKMDITGKNIVISNNANTWGAVHVANKTEDSDYADVATLDIKGENIFIKNSAEKGVGVAAMSQGVVNIEGNTTIQAQKAIAARGGAKVNVNTSGENTVKMLGDIDFDYDKATSGTSIDAYIDVTLAGDESFWTGNTVVTYDEKPEAEKLAVSNAKLTMKDGAVWNATKITDNKADVKGRYYTALNDLIINGGTVNIADTTRGITIDRIVANDATFTGGMLNVNESIDIESGETLFNGNVTGAEGATLTLASGATMDIGTSTIKFDTMTLNGTVIASVTNGRPYGHLFGDITAGEDALLKLNVGSVGTYKIFNDADANMKIDAGLAYVVTNNGADGIVVETKSIESLAEDAGISTQAAGAIAGLTMTQDPALQKVSLAAQQALNSGDASMIAMVERETKKLNPTDKPVAQAAATSVQNQVLSLAAGRMSGGAVMGRAGGDEIAQENGFWVQGLFNKSKFADEFHGYTRGVALGADTTIDKTWTVGAGLAFNNSDVHADGVHTDIDSKTLFVYGQYKPSNWFVNGTATYTMSEYTDSKTVFDVVWNDSYDVNSYGAQVMGGYDFAAGITTEAGLRYLHIAQDATGFARALDTDFLTGVAGVKYAFAIENDWAIKLRPELRAALTYDWLNDSDAAIVDMPGVATYKVDGENLNRLGAELGAGVTLDYKGLKVTLMYDLDLHKEYTSQTGMIKFRSRF